MRQKSISLTCAAFDPDRLIACSMPEDLEADIVRRWLRMSMAFIRTLTSTCSIPVRLSQPMASICGFVDAVWYLPESQPSQDSYRSEEWTSRRTIPRAINKEEDRVQQAR